MAFVPPSSCRGCSANNSTTCGAWLVLLLLLMMLVMVQETCRFGLIFWGAVTLFAAFETPSGARACWQCINHNRPNMNACLCVAPTQHEGKQP